MSQFDEDHGLDGPTCAKCGMVNCVSFTGCERRVAIKRKSEADYERGIAEGERRERARTAAAVAAAREEQREADAKFCPNCLGVGFVERPVPCPYCDDSTHDHYCPTVTQRQQCGCGAERIRATPLTSTPLADRIAELERVLAKSLANRIVEKAKQADQPCGHPAAVANRSAETGVAFCDLCRLNEMLNDALAMEAKHKAERDALRDQVEEARAGLTEIACFHEGPEVHGGFDEPGSAQTARDTLAAMDEAKP